MFSAMYSQVNKILHRRKFLFHHTLRFIQCDSHSGILYPLKSRKLIKITGSEASTYLQGLITNDMRHFESHKSLYAMFLNNKGRVLFDTLIHKCEDENSYLIETDKKTLDLLHKHLKIYKLRRQIKIEDMSLHFNIYTLITQNVPDADLEIDAKRNLNIYKDPRLTDLGFRVVTSSSLEANDVANSFNKNISIDDNEEKYKCLRYKLGVGEGADDLPPGSSFPLEANCDYLHGVSFHKGCYIGQELTARVHHTGVIRKRIMPLRFNESVKNDIVRESVISPSNNNKVNVGKLKGVIGKYGLGLMRVKEVMDNKALVVGGYTLEAVKPSWWPVEASKEKFGAAKETQQES